MENLHIIFKIPIKKIFLNIFLIIFIFVLSSLIYFLPHKNIDFQYIALFIVSILLYSLGLYVLIKFISEIFYYNIQKKGIIKITDNIMKIKFVFKKDIIIPLTKLIDIRRIKYKTKNFQEDNLFILADINMPSKEFGYPEIKFPTYILGNISINDFVLNVKKLIVDQYKKEVLDSKNQIKSSLQELIKNDTKKISNYEKGKLYKFNDIVYEILGNDITIYFKEYDLVNFNFLNKMLFISRFNCFYEINKNIIKYFKIDINSIINFYSDIDFNNIKFPKQLQMQNNYLIIDLGGNGNVIPYPYECSIFVDYKTKEIEYIKLQNL
ncbi:MAG: hypothetical protein A2Y34_09660 [Spirochaetes bacterium GWC1_27_15]|nr:MAG: hypothetical protein A2Z98_18325 [Spirochaetes bacterium GWB1_27_13]OHD28274.1 MAG: hypothetical protein A2Y34_09660 [Spirochaetes bacterium GWC1_27_15]